MTDATPRDQHPVLVIRNGQRGHFTAEAKRAAVDAVLESGRPVQRVARLLGCEQSTLRYWVSEDPRSKGCLPTAAMKTREAAMNQMAAVGLASLGWGRQRIAKVLEVDPYTVSNYLRKAARGDLYVSRISRQEDFDEARQPAMR